MKKIIVVLFALLPLTPLLAEESPSYSDVQGDEEIGVDLEGLFERGQELSSEYIMANYAYVNSLLGLDQKDLVDAFSWTVTTGNMVYYWNAGDEPTFGSQLGGGDIEAQYIKAAPQVTFDIPTSGTAITVTSPFMVDLNNSDNSSVTPGVQLSQSIVGAKSYENQISSLETQKAILGAESNLQKAEINLENSVLVAVSDLFDARLGYEKSKKILADAELHMKNIKDALGYTEESTTYQESTMALLQAEQALNHAQYDLTKAEDELEMLTGVRTVTFEELNLTAPTLALDELRATTSLMLAELELSIAESKVKQSKSEDTFSLGSTFGAEMTIDNDGIANPTLSTGLQASVNDGLTFGVSATTNLDKKDIAAGVSFSYMPKVYNNSTIASDMLQNTLLMTIEKKNTVESLYTRQQAQLQNQIELWDRSYDIALRRYDVALSQYEHGKSLLDQGYSSERALKEKEISLMDAQNAVLQSLISGLQLERSIELFYNS